MLSVEEEKTDILFKYSGKFCPKHISFVLAINKCGKYNSVPNKLLEHSSQHSGNLIHCESSITCAAEGISSESSHHQTCSLHHGRNKNYIVLKMYIQMIKRRVLPQVSCSSKKVIEVQHKHRTAATGRHIFSLETSINT